jgi:hypothetical protein
MQLALPAAGVVRGSGVELRLAEEEWLIVWSLERISTTRRRCAVGQTGSCRSGRSGSKFSRDCCGGVDRAVWLAQEWWASRGRWFLVGRRVRRRHGTIGRGCSRPLGVQPAWSVSQVRLRSLRRRADWRVHHRLGSGAGGDSALRALSAGRILATGGQRQGCGGTYPFGSAESSSRRRRECPPLHQTWRLVSEHAGRDSGGGERGGGGEEREG